MIEWLLFLNQLDYTFATFYNLTVFILCFYVVIYTFVLESLKTLMA